MIKKSIKTIVSAALLFVAVAVIFVVRDGSPALRQRLARYPVFSSLASVRDKVAMEAKLTTLNHYIPPFTDLAHAAVDGEMPPEKSLQSYMDYYKRVIDVFPAEAEAYGMLGFCQYALGHPQDAVGAYQKAVFLNPRLFAFYYNLGVILLKQGQFLPASQFFQKALTVDIPRNLQFTLQSRIYAQIFGSAPALVASSEARLKAFYIKSGELAVLSRQFAGRIVPVDPRVIEEARFYLF